MIESSVVMRKCKECAEEKSLLDNFRPHTVKGKLYFEYECRKCGNARANKWYHDNNEYARAQDRAQYRENADESRAKGRADYSKNREKRRAMAAKRRKENLERVRAQDRVIARRWRAAHPFESREWARKQRAIKRKARTEPITKAQIDSLYVKQRGKCGVCRKKLVKHHIDHIKPLARGGEHNIRNFQLLCPGCNLSKRHSDPIDFMQKLGFLL